MKRTNLLLQQAMTRTVDLEPLSSRVFSKYLKFIDEKVKQCMKQPLQPKFSKLAMRNMPPPQNSVDDSNYSHGTGGQMDSLEESKMALANSEHPEMTSMNEQ